MHLGLHDRRAAYGTVRPLNRTTLACPPSHPLRWSVGCGLQTRSRERSPDPETEFASSTFLGNPDRQLRREKLLAIMSVELGAAWVHVIGLCF